MFDDAQKVYNFADGEFPHLPKVIWGRSIGTGIAAQLAANNDAKELVLETPYFTLEEIAEAQQPYLPVRLLLKYPIRTCEYIAKVDYPIFIIHGTSDNIIPYNAARKLAGLTHTTFVTVPGGNHELDGTNEFKDFLDQTLK